MCLNQLNKHQLPTDTNANANKGQETTIFSNVHALYFPAITRKVVSFTPEVPGSGTGSFSQS